MLGQEVLSRKIVITGEINEQTAHEVIAKIMEINDYDAQMSVVSTYEPEPIEIFINSGGGHVSDGFAIIGAMETSETPIVTYAFGLCASMALAIFVAGDVRIVHRFCRMMYHSISYGMVGYIQDHEDMGKETDLLQRMYNSLILDRTKLTSDKLDDIRKMKKDYFFSGKEAVKFGVADDVLLKPEKKFEFIKESELQALQEAEEK